MTGMGGASLMTPLLILIFGIQPVTAIGTDIFYAAVTKTVGGYKHLKLGTVHKGLAFWLAVGSVPSAIAGVWVIELLQRSTATTSTRSCSGMLGGALLVVGDRDPAALAVLLRRDPGALGDAPLPAPHHRRDHDRRSLTGFVIGLTSAGSGTLIAIAPDRDLPPHPAARGRHRHLPRRGPALGGGRRALGRRQHRLLLAATILVGSIPGVIVGTNLSVKAPQKFLRYALAVVLSPRAQR